MNESYPLFVLKFGGSSLSTPDRILNAVEILRPKLQDGRVAVVVSALGGVTNELIAITDLALKGGNEWEVRFDQLIKKHYQTAEQLLDSAKLTNLSAEWSRLFDLLKGAFEQVTGEKRVSLDKQDYILSFGERLSNRLFAAVLDEKGIPAHAYDSHKFVRTSDDFGDARVDESTTRKLIQDTFRGLNGAIPVITGFIGSTESNRITTLGRSGSDYTAGIVGEALGARHVEIWTDVSGVFTADPNHTPTAYPIQKINYHEMAEMAHFGSTVVHPKTVIPVEQQKIPVYIKNTFKPEDEGTLITQQNGETTGVLRSVSLREHAAIMALHSRGLKHVPRLLTRALSAFEKEKLHVWFTASASTELGFTVAISDKEQDRALDIIRNTFREELDDALLREPEVLSDVSLVTIIGDRLIEDTGLAGDAIRLLNRHGIRPLAYSRGHSNRHFTITVPTDSAIRTVRLLHDEYCLPHGQVRLFIAGIGNVGGTLLRLLNKHLRQDYFRIIGACDSRRMVWYEPGLASDKIREELNQRGEDLDWDKITDRLANSYGSRTIFVDTTGSEIAAQIYEPLLEKGVHIATSSKIANTREQAYFDRLYELSSHGTHFYYETTVGAGLPVLSTLDNFLSSGDPVTGIEGVVSGTLSFLFDRLNAGSTFSQAVKEAYDRGYTEPNPRDDLSGEDVARKFLTLSRCIGVKIERSDVVVENLVPESLQDISIDEFWEKLSSMDNDWAKKVEEAKSNNQRLVFTGKLVREANNGQNGSIHVGVETVDSGSPLYNLHGTDNLILFRTDFYDEQPMVIQGPGAGPEVTASGLLVDILKIRESITH